jgi:hypothetical protein
VLGRQIRAGLAELERHDRELSPRAARFWELAFEADRALLEALWRQGAALSVAAGAKIADRYRMALTRGGSRREKRSILEQIAFFARMAQALPPRKRDAVHGWLDSISQALSATP